MGLSVFCCLATSSSFPFCFCDAGGGGERGVGHALPSEDHDQPWWKCTSVFLCVFVCALLQDHDQPWWKRTSVFLCFFVCALLMVATALRNRYRKGLQLVMDDKCVSVSRFGSVIRRPLR